MKKLSLPEWAQIAEIGGSIAVVISLIALVISINQNTAALSARGVDDIFDSWREYQVLLSSNPDLHEILLRAQSEPDSLSELETARYELQVGMVLDMWSRMTQRVQDGLIDERIAASWDAYFAEWTRRSVTRAQWEQWKWGWANPDFRARVEAVLDH